MAEKPVLIFDFDGTLVNSMGSFASLAAHLMGDYYGTKLEWAKKQYQLTSGLPFCEQLERIFPKHPLNFLISLIFEEYKKAFYKTYPFFPDVQEALENLKKNGYRLVVSSNNKESLIRQKLVNHLSFFDLILGYRTGFSKGPQHFNHIQNQLACNTNEMIFIGDSLHDGAMAKKCNIPFIARIGTFSSSTFKKQGIALAHIDSLNKLIPIFENKTLDSQNLFLET
ncbi:MAG: hypothetical protein A3G32_08190 [Deltaproteobacteria bacterium RIFCSPLOWO2_12_FULL_40_28]|nr:MAG: hypothetical protein A3C45_00890 [Deltaproteobacteria bacterium RIFCSPHIGHO2_02_FULL_40_28]OGQ20889.1 MAG: hypothetical protein A3E27_03555 [Deltaproteobacteria bacterium RIFCSPHIGHO2_12_FULL_40_32]OGQ39290.1 MAG: hypothetical protein A3I69_04915 [Deltaproteobacteria bacterium RIFCSPLOWO2_02_FULL_40_36]OGQ54571.1 MAG: hypothetical protein A3G32_08190 [Deltaproteobacteria bacterium RIFCSPLOWO2_12_FULL_40_28]